MTQFSEIIRETATNMGGTFAFNGTEVPTTGYMVGGAAPELIIPWSDVEGGEIRKYAEQWAPLLELHGFYLGTWINPETDLLHIDISQHFTDIFKATHAGQIRGELAVYDIAAGQAFQISGDLGAREVTL